MDTVAHYVDLLGFLILIVSGAAAFLSLLTWRSKQTRHPLSLGINLTLFFLTAALMSNSLFSVLPPIPEMMRDGIHKSVQALGWLSFAFLLNSSLKRFIWYGRLRHGDRSAVPDILIGFASLGIYAAAILFISSIVFHRDITAIAATSGVVAFVLGYSAQPTLSEIFSGLALNISRPFRIGDSVQVDGVWGNILELGWRSVSLRSYEGNLIVLPNSKAASMRLINMDLPQHHTRHHIPFVMDIEVPPSLVRKVAMEAILSVPTVLRTPAPLVLWKTFHEYGMSYEAIFWQADPNLWILRQDEVGGAMWYAFKRAGLPFAVNRRNANMPTLAIPSVPHADPAQEREEILAVLKRSSLFSLLPEDAQLTLTSTAKRRLYGDPERIVRQGDQGSSMFLIVHGKVDVLHEGTDGSEQKITTLGAGESFGHMSLMTGAPRSATVRAGSHLVLAEIEKSALTPVIAQYPEAVEALATQIMALQNANEELHFDDGQPASDTPAGVLGRLASKIRAFLHHGK